jgi:hypothetical protein
MSTFIHPLEDTAKPALVNCDVMVYSVKAGYGNQGRASWQRACRRNAGASGDSQKSASKLKLPSTYLGNVGKCHL